MKDLLALAGEKKDSTTAFTGKPGKRFCSDRCRTRFGRERAARRTQELHATIVRLAKLAGVVSMGELASQ